MLPLATLVMIVSLIEREFAAANGLSYTDQLIVDTGSANTWVGAQKKYVQTSTSVNINRPLSVLNAIGLMLGNAYSDTVTFGDNYHIADQLIGNASEYPDLNGADGVLGIGPVVLSRGTLTNQVRTIIPTVTRSLYTQGTISQELVSLSFEPMSSNEFTYGELTFGTTDTTRYTGAIAWT